MAEARVVMSPLEIGVHSIAGNKIVVVPRTFGISCSTVVGHKSICRELERSGIMSFPEGYCSKDCLGSEYPYITAVVTRANNFWEDLRDWMVGVGQVKGLNISLSFKAWSGNKRRVLLDECGFARYCKTDEDLIVRSLFHYVYTYYSKVGYSHLVKTHLDLSKQYLAGTLSSLGCIIDGSVLAKTRRKGNDRSA